MAKKHGAEHANTQGFALRCIFGHGRQGRGLKCPTFLSRKRYGQFKQKTTSNTK